MNCSSLINYSTRSGPQRSRQLNNTSNSLNVSNSRMNSTSRNNRANISTTSNIGLFNTNVIMSITEGRGKAKGEIGLSYIDLNSPILHLAQFMDNCSFDSLRMKCSVCSPVEIIFPYTFVENNVMIQTLTSFFPDIDFKPFDRRFFNERKGFEFVQTLCYQNHTWIDIELESKFYSLSACAALMQYLFTTKQVKYAHKTMKIVFQSSLNTLVIDPTTAKILELIINLNDPKSSDTLIGTINRTKTKSGYVLLRSNILQPSTDIDLVKLRLDMVDAMSKSLEAFNEFDSILASFGNVDLDKLIVNTIQLPTATNNNNQFLRLAERKIEHVLQVKYAISLVDQLKQVFVINNDPIWESYVKELSNPGFNAIQELIDAGINSEARYVKGPANMKLEKCFAIKDRFNALLDLARGIYFDLIEDIVALVRSYEVKFKFAEIKIANSVSKGYFMQIKNPRNEDPNFSMQYPFQDVTYSKNCISFTSDDLLRLNSRMNKTIEEIYIQSDKTISLLINDIRAHISCFYSLVEIVGTTDLIFSFTYQSSISNYVRPEFNNYLEIKNGRHPVLDKISTSIPNCIFMNGDLNFHIITGPNMSGKTTFLKQLALLQIMAQIGSFVPAEWATFTMCRKLFTRMGLNDNLQINSSSFMVEMKELKFILENLSSNCLILIDELGRGCMNKDIISMCWAICESLLASKAYTIFATHFVELTSLAKIYLNVSNYHFSSEILHDNLVSKYPHILLEGPTSERLYGIELAQMSGLNETIIGYAKEAAYQITAEIESFESEKNDDEEFIEKRAKYLMVAKLVHMLYSRNEPISAEKLAQLKNNYDLIKENVV